MENCYSVGLMCSLQDTLWQGISAHVCWTLPAESDLLKLPQAPLNSYA